MKWQETQAYGAELFRRQHHSGKLLILPNIWEPMGAKLMVKAGYPSVATASVATAFSNGFADGEKIPFAQLLTVVGNIVSAVSVPVTVDIERGYANNISQLKENINLLIERGAVGINIEDSMPDQKGLYDIGDHCRKIEAVRETAIQSGVPLVINARSDMFSLKMDNAVNIAIERGKAYKSAGADCFYPILVSNYDHISTILDETKMPVNVNLLKPVSDLHRLEKMGVARVSVGPQLLYHILTTMKQMADSLYQYDATAFFGRELISREFLNQLL
jgi:2-methylisocitrate lyase-like PEP mutase family enzyme